MRVCIVLATLSLCVCSVASAAEVELNCARAGAAAELDALLRAPDLAPGTTVRIKGICHGNFVTEAADLRIAAASPGAGIEGGISARGPGRLVLQGLVLEDGSGAIDVGMVRAIGAERSLWVVDCELRDAPTGVEADGGAAVLLRHSTVRASWYGLLANRTSSVYVEDSVVEGAGFGAGVGVFTGSSALITHSQLRKNSIGIWAENLATVFAIGGTETSDSQLTQLALRDRSRGVVSEATLGAGGGAGNIGAVLESDSSLATGPGGEVFGDVLAASGSSIWLEGGTLHGSVTLQDFSRLRAGPATVEGTVQCESGADAVCGPGAVVTTSGCPSAPETCAARGGRAPAPFPQLPPPTWMRPPFPQWEDRPGELSLDPPGERGPRRR